MAARPSAPGGASPGAMSGFAPFRLGLPEQWDISCPDCGARAVFEAPFLFAPADQAADAADDRPRHRWGGSLVVEKFPSLLRWPEGIKAYRHFARGVRRCAGCRAVAVHDLDWPADAYWARPLGGGVLWAWSAEHARILRGFIGSMQRRRVLARSGPYARSLQRLPAPFLGARLRPLIVRRITASLEADARCGAGRGASARGWPRRRA